MCVPPPPSYRELFPQGTEQAHKQDTIELTHFVRTYVHGSYAIPTHDCSISLEREREREGGRERERERESRESRERERDSWSIIINLDS